MASGWGPVHFCQGGCGQEVQHNGYRLYDAGTDNRHLCPRHQDLPAPIRWMECLCGRDIEVVGEVRYELGSTIVHRCGGIPVSEKVIPLKKPDLLRYGPRGPIG